MGRERQRDGGVGVWVSVCKPPVAEARRCIGGGGGRGGAPCALGSNRFGMT